MKAIVHAGTGIVDGLRYTAYSDKRPEKGEVKIRLKTAGLNHRELFLLESRSEKDLPFIPGSDGAGVIEAVGEDVPGLTPGTKVIINPSLNWEKTDLPPAIPEILGGPSDGTFAEFVTVPWQNAIPKPQYLSWEEAGVLSLSALTAYRALFTKGKLQQGQHVLIPGIGGGVAIIAALMALAAGARVSVTSRKDSALKAALKLGVNRAFHSPDNWKEHLKDDPADLILDSIGPAVFSQYPGVMKPDGRIVMFGASSGEEIVLSSRAIFFPQINISGTSMGSGEEYTAMLSFMEKHRLRPIIDMVFPLKDTALAFQRMMQGEHFGKIAVLID